MKELKCGSQQYAWGKYANSSMVAKLHGPEAFTKENINKRYAELWIGVHDSLPSRVLPQNVLLKDYLINNKERYLGEEHIKHFGGPKIPFLLKALSADMALSIQAHPNRELAQKLHARDPKHYPDPNHKPELVVALTRFEALCCFRPIAEIVHFIKQSKPFQEILGADVVNRLEQVEEEDQKEGGGGGVPTSTPAVKAALRVALTRLYSADQSSIAAAVQEQVKKIEHNELTASASGENNDNDTTNSTGSNTIGSISSEKVPLLNAAHEVFVRTNKDFPGDVGLWMIYFLNYIVLQPGDGLFLGANEPHAYISGDSIEIMANSDNVVRAGLTPKFKDVPTLIDMLTYDTKSILRSRYRASLDKVVQEYRPPSWCDDFSLFVVRLDKKKKGFNKVCVRFPSVGLGMCVKGSTRCINYRSSPSTGYRLKQKQGVKFGTKFLLPPGPVTFELTKGDPDQCTVFVATTNLHGAKKGGKSKL